MSARWTIQDLEGLALKNLAKDRQQQAENRRALQNPPGRPKIAEHDLQAQCVKWFRMQYPNMGKLLLSIPNGAQLAKGARGWKRLEREGAVAGAPDLILLVPSGDYGFLCIEMKTQKGRQRQSQKSFENEIVQHGGAYCIPRSLAQFIELVRSYLERGEF